MAEQYELNECIPKADNIKVKIIIFGGKLMGKLILDIPYEEKEIAKEISKRNGNCLYWNTKQKKWVLYGTHNYKHFRQWIPESYIIANNIYIIETKRHCWKCGKEITIVCLGYVTGQYLRLLSDITPMPKWLKNYLKERYGYQYKYSNVCKESYFANVCKFCNSLQGRNYLFEDPYHEFYSNETSPFWINSQAKIDNLVIYKIPLDFDLTVEYEYYDDGVSLSELKTIQELILRQED